MAAKLFSFIIPAPSIDQFVVSFQSDSQSLLLLLTCKIKVKMTQSLRCDECERCNISTASDITAGVVAVSHL